MTKLRIMPAPKALSTGEEQFALDCKRVGLAPVREFQFSKRKFRADFGFVAEKLLVEVEGGIWIRGRHNRASSIEKDFVKYSLAAILGYRVIRCSTDQVMSGQAIDWTLQALK